MLVVLLGEGSRFGGVSSLQANRLFGELFCSRNSKGMAREFNLFKSPKSRYSKIASFVLFSCLEAKVSPTDGKLARTYRVRVQFGVSLESFSVEDRGTKGMAARPQGRKGLHLRPSPAISS